MALVTMSLVILDQMPPVILDQMPLVILDLASDTTSDASMPGLGSFIVFAFLAVALYFLLKNMNARLRRMSYREKERQAAEAAATEREATTGEADRGTPETPENPETPDTPEDRAH